MEDYIKYIRGKIGHNMIILNYAGCIISDERKML